jgi:seryl-tRNA synthetase
MLDIKLIREDPTTVERALATRGAEIALAPVLAADTERRRLVTEAEDLKAERNRASEAIGQAKRRGEDPQGATARMREVSDRIKALDGLVKEADARLEGLLLEVPNLPHASVPVGRSADDNVEVRRWGAPRQFAFEPKQHFEIGEALGILDFDRASKIAKSRFTVMWGAASRLNRALVQLMLDLHTREHGFTEVWVPHLVNPETMVGVAMLPKFEEQMFRTVEPEAGRTLYLIPTAEVALTALHGAEILPEAELPKRYCAFTPCYRREAGTYGQDTKGMIRQHQFDKVEMVKVVAPGQSYDELESMVRSAEAVLQRLELPYRVMALCTGDMGFHSATTYDLEVWLPGRPQVPAGGRRARGALPHPERIGARGRAHADRGARELPGSRRVRHGAGRAPPLPGRPRAHRTDGSGTLVRRGGVAESG